MSALSRAASDLADAMAGSVLLPDGDGYDDARVSFNGTIDRWPALIARCANVDDVQLAVRAACELDLPISVRGGGHSVAGHGIGEGAVMIDLSPMRAVEVDAERRLARVGGGCLWGDVDAATQAVGLAVPGGTYGDTGVGGLTLGGGIGWLLGTAGLTCDNLVRAAGVSGTGELVVAGEDGDPELLWALRGGGGNFAVITSFELALHECGPVVGGFVSFPLEAAEVVLACLQELTDRAPDELVVMPEIGRDDLCTVGVAFAGGSADADRALAPLRGCAPVVSETVTTRSYLELQAMNEIIPFGRRHYWKGHFVSRLDADAIRAVPDGARRAPAGSEILMEAITGAARRVPEESASFGLREAGWNVSAIAVWDDPRNDADAIAWARDVVDTLAPFSVNGGGYVNYIPPDETPERVFAAYGAERFTRLAAVKRRYDPDNRLRFNLNIPPA